MTFPIYQPPKPAQVRRSRAMRKKMTEAETRLWRALRHGLPTYHIRRQVPIGDYVVDFCCYGSRLVLEVDGNQHGFDRQRLHDEQRTKVLERRGFRILRFANEDVFRTIDCVLDTIFAHLTEKVDPQKSEGADDCMDVSPPPCGEGQGVGVVVRVSAASRARLGSAR